MKKKVYNLGIILLGNFLYSMAVAFFILPVGLITGGTTGIAIFVQHYTGLAISTFVSIFNVTMFILGAVFLGRKFAMTTLVSTFVYPFFLRIGEALSAKTGVLTTDSMLCTVFAGLLIGAGIGLVMQAGASTGGMDIPPLIINKKTGLPVGAMLYGFDVLILILQMSISDRQQVLYGILLVCIYSYTLEKLLIAGKGKIQIKIISEKYEEINEKIATQFDRGTTLYEIEGGYTRREMYAILTVVSRRELFAINEMVQEIDPDAFIVIGQVKEVRGRGFTKVKKYE